MLGCCFIATVIVRQLIFKAPTELERRVLILSNLMITHSRFLLRACCFSLINVLWIVSSFGLIFRVLKKRILDFCQCSHCFYIGADSWRSPIPEVHLLSYFLWFHQPSFLFGGWQYDIFIMNYRTKQYLFLWKAIEKQFCGKISLGKFCT